MEKLPVYKTEGLIIKSADLCELDRLITVYSRSEGKILARAISARKKESKLRGYLEPFTYSNFLLAKSKTIDIITDIEPIDNFSHLHGNLESLAYAYYFAELIDKVVVAPERDDKIWALIKRAMEVLDSHAQYRHSDPAKAGEESRGSEAIRATKKINLPQIKSLFEQKLLEFLGHPSFSTQGKLLERGRQNYLNLLAGERIKSVEFLSRI